MAAHLEPAARRLADIAQPAVGVVVDVGSGSGNGLRASRAVGSAIVGLELSAQQLAVAATLGVPQVRGDAACLPFRSTSVAAVTSNFGVIFSPTVDACFAEIARVLRTDGRLVFTAWCDGGWPQAGLSCFAGHLHVHAPNFPVSLGAIDHTEAVLDAAGLVLDAAEEDLLTWECPDLDAAVETITTAAGGLRALRRRLELAGSWNAAASDFRLLLAERARSTAAGIAIDDAYVLYQAVPR